MPISLLFTQQIKNKKWKSLLSEEREKKVLKEAQKNYNEKKKNIYQNGILNNKIKKLSEKSEIKMMMKSRY